MKRFEPGQQIEAPVAAVSGGTIFLDLNLKSEGVLSSAEFTGEDGRLTVKEGDVIRAFFLEERDGELRFTSKLSSDGIDASVLENACRSGIPVEGRVQKEIKGGYEVSLGKFRAFCPYSQMGYRNRENAGAYVGKKLPFKVQEYREDGRRILVSNRRICEEEERSAAAGLEKRLGVGDVVSGTVESVQPFGAFVDIGGFRALLPVSELSRGRVEDIHAVLKEGQTVEAKIIGADFAGGRVSLSVKALRPDPWDTAAEKYPAGTRASGTVARITDFGLFVSLEPGLDGLVHISELPDAGKNTNLRQVYKTGAPFDVVVEKNDAAHRRLSLKPAPSAAQDAAAGRYLSGQDEADTYNPFALLLKKQGDGK